MWKFEAIKEKKEKNVKSEEWTEEYESKMEQTEEAIVVTEPCLVLGNGSCEWFDFITLFCHYWLLI